MEPQGSSSRYVGLADKCRRSAILPLAVHFSASPVSRQQPAPAQLPSGRQSRSIFGDQRLRPEQDRQRYVRMGQCEATANLGGLCCKIAVYGVAETTPVRMDNGTCVGCRSGLRVPFSRPLSRPMAVEGKVAVRVRRVQGRGLSAKDGFGSRTAACRVGGLGLGLDKTRLYISCSTPKMRLPRPRMPSGPASILESRAKWPPFADSRASGTQFSSTRTAIGATAFEDLGLSREPV